MGILKNLFVEEIPDETPDIPDIDTDFDTTGTDVELDSVNTDTLIDDIYSQNNLADNTQSIFKVEESGLGNSCFPGHIHRSCFLLCHRFFLIILRVLPVHAVVLLHRCTPDHHRPEHRLRYGSL